jgi:phosphate transport system substrate-binding protein
MKINKKWILVILPITIAITALLLWAPFSVSKVSPEKVVINPGKQLYYGGLDDVVAAFEAKTGIDVVYGTIGGCGASSAGLKDGSLDIGAFCCPLNFEETGKYGMVDTSIARDAIQFVVNVSNPVDNLTLDQIRGIYQGTITDWSEVGGNPGPITPYAHIMCGPRQEVARQTLVGTWDPANGHTCINNALFADTVVNEGDELNMAGLVEADPNGIAHVSRSFADMANVKVISVDGVFPTPETIMDGSYPVVRYLHMGTKGVPGGNVERFLDYLLSDEGQAILSAQGKILPRD